MLITTGTLAKQLGVSREQILADLEQLHITPERDSIGRRLLNKAQVRWVELLHRQRAQRRRKTSPLGS